MSYINNSIKDGIITKDTHPVGTMLYWRRRITRRIRGRRQKRTLFVNPLEK